MAAGFFMTAESIHTDPGATNPAEVNSRSTIDDMGASRHPAARERPAELVPVDPRRLAETTPFVFELPPDKERGMRVPARVFADSTLLGQIGRDRSLAQ